MVRQPHFVQGAGQPVFIGQGTGELACRCGESVLVRGYDPSNFLAVDFQCGHCGQITTTPGLSALSRPPVSIVGLDRSALPPRDPTPIPPGTVLAGREEMDRILALYEPGAPSVDLTLTPSLLEALAEDYNRLSGRRLDEHMAAVAAAGSAPFAGMRDHPLVWAIRFLRGRFGDPDWSSASNEESALATTLIGAFRHFNECWARHPLFPMMAAAAGDTGFSFHGLAPFATAKALFDSGNKVGFAPPADGSGRVREFAIGLSPTETMACVVEAFDRFERPFGKPPADFEALRSAVLDRLAASQGRINLKHPGMLVFSAGASSDAFDQSLIDAILTAFHSHGRRHRSVAAMAVIAPKVKLTARRETVQFGYGFYPIANKQARLGSGVRIGSREELPGG